MDSKIRTLRSGKRLFIEDSDPSSALPVLVCLHGLGSSTTFYEASLGLSHLTSTHRLIRYDMDGHGLSPVSGEDVSIASLVEDLVRVLEFSGVGGRVSLVGHSMGGAVALTFSALYPRRVSSLRTSFSAPGSLELIPRLQSY
jgi:pimeloyl-ACP methyl ester carboxylesterase